MIYSFEPIFDENSRILILGSMASVKSLEAGFYYMHPQNKFWRVISEITGKSLPASKEGKKTLLLTSGIAVMDILYSCEREGSLDSAIKNYAINDLYRVLNKAKIAKIYCNGKTSYNIAKKAYPELSFEYLPSTSPANNGAFDYSKWLAIAEYLK